MRTHAKTEAIQAEQSLEPLIAAVQLQRAVNTANCIHISECRRRTRLPRVVRAQNLDEAVS
jgi:hypothetical protein